MYAELYQSLKAKLSKELGMLPKEQLIKLQPSVGCQEACRKATL